MILNHIPVVGGVGALLLLGWGLLRKSADVTAAALSTYVIVALIAIPVFLTGPGAADAVQKVEGIPPGMLEMHREVAVCSLIGLESAAATAIAALYAGRSRRRAPMFPAIATMILGFAAAVLLVRAASLGGQIRHSELRPPTAARAAVGR